MRIVHTADWHLGKVLHKHSLAEEQEHFIDWFCDLISKEKVDLVLISGDIFDKSNPSSLDRKRYYDALVRISSKGAMVILTGGNHDSPGVLEAAKSLLEPLNVRIIGAARDQIDGEILHVELKEESSCHRGCSILKSHGSKECLFGIN